MIQTPPRANHVVGYSIALLCLGAFLLLGALQIRFLGATSSDGTPFSFISNLLVLFGSACLVVSLLRWRGAAVALPMTAALSIVLLIAFPIGTILSLYWLTNVRQKEAVVLEESESVWFNYTVGLYILGLLLLDTALILQFVVSSPGPESRALEILTLGVWIVGLAALAIAALRSFSVRGGHLATLILNVLVVLWFPLGTVLALIWFFAVRKHEKALLAQSDLPRPIAA
jgi:hypothetical protein